MFILDSFILCVDFVYHWHCVALTVFYFCVCFFDGVVYWRALYFGGGPVFSGGGALYFGGGEWILIF